MRAPPPLPQEAVSVPGVGPCFARGMLLTRRQELLDASAGNNLAIMLSLMAESVVEEAGGPVYDAAGWDQYGAAYPDAFREIFEAVRRVIGLNKEAIEKNA